MQYYGIMAGIIKDSYEQGDELVTLKLQL